MSHNKPLKFRELTKAQQETASNKYIFDSDEANLYFDQYLRPYVQEEYGQMYCSLKPKTTFDDFHNYSGKQNQG